ncbi:acyl-CoA carboxylase subunit beta [Caproiciproducens galactitolivorans]|uniref:acyl-CoA carboxylase subunit beta n=1 Tax=Caproiciproducens galactitolivorans TaxID=642589 RepID=UPI0024092B61|nr:carboxyl transferase domain-containing protein [Caproiciproducens galactitolivorans]
MNKVDNAELLHRLRDSVESTTGYQRINALFDAGSFNEIDCFAKSGENLAEVITGYGTIEGCPVFVFSQNKDIEGGAMSKAQASKIKKLYNLALRTGTPIIGIYDSIGGRLKEGSDIFAAYGDVLANANELSGVVPQISLILGPCIGTSAMIAASADFIVMSKNSELTIDTNGEHGSAEEAAKMGICHIVSEDEQDAISTVRKLVTLLPSNNLSGIPVLEMQAISDETELTCDSDMRTVLTAVCDDASFVELGDRFGTSSITGFAEIDGSTTGIVALQGVLDADSCTKAARFIRFCDAFSLPIVTFVNAEKFESLREASKLSSSYSEATTGKITVITGSAYGPVYIAVAGRGANSDYTMAWPNSVVSPLAPETAAIFLWNDRLANSANPVEDRKKLIEEYKETEASPFAVAADGYIEDIVHPKDTRIRVIANLQMLAEKRVSGLSKKHSNIQI